MIYFFTEPELLKKQEDDDLTFGIVDDKNFRFMSRHQCKEGAHAISVTKGVPCYVKDHDGGLTCILKPTSFVEFGGVPVAYFIYWGIEESSILSGDNLRAPSSGNNKDNTIIDDLFDGSIDSPNLSHLGLDKTYTVEQYLDELFINDTNYFISAGKELGSFHYNKDVVGFAVVLKSSFNKPKVELLTSLTFECDLICVDENEALEDEVLKRNSIINFIDPAAFFGNNMLNNGDWESEHNKDILSKFKYHRWYFDIRNENDLPFTIYKNSITACSYSIENNTTESPASKSLLIEKWPIFYFEAGVSEFANQDWSQDKSFTYINLGVQFDEEVRDKKLIGLFSHVYKGGEDGFNKIAPTSITKAYLFNVFIDYKSESPDESFWQFTSNVTTVDEKKVFVPNYNRLSLLHEKSIKNDDLVSGSVNYIKTIDNSFLYSGSFLDNIFQVKPLEEYPLPNVEPSESANVNDIGIIKPSYLGKTIVSKRDSKLKDFRLIKAGVSIDALSKEKKDNEGNVIGLEPIGPEFTRITFLVQCIASSFNKRNNFKATGPSANSDSSFGHISNGIGGNKIIKKTGISSGADEFTSLALIADYDLTEDTPDDFFAISMTLEEHERYLKLKNDFFSSQHPVFFQVHNHIEDKDSKEESYQEISLRLAGLDLEGKPICLIPEDKPNSGLSSTVFRSYQGSVFATNEAAALEKDNDFNYDGFLKVNIVNAVGTDEYELLDEVINLISNKSGELSGGGDILNKLNKAIIKGLYMAYPEEISPMPDMPEEYAVKLESATRRWNKINVNIELVNDVETGYAAVTTNGDVLKISNNHSRADIPGNIFVNNDEIGNINDYDAKGLKPNIIEELLDKSADKNYTYDLKGDYSILKLIENPMRFFEPEVILNKKYDKETNSIVTDKTVLVSKFKNSGIGEIENDIYIKIDGSLSNFKENGGPIQLVDNDQNKPNDTFDLSGGLKLKHLNLAKTVIHELAHAYMYIYNPLLSQSWGYLEKYVNSSGNKKNNYVFAPVNGDVHDGHLYANPSGALAILIEAELGRVFDKMINKGIRDLKDPSSGGSSVYYAPSYDKKFGEIEDKDKPVFGL